MKSARPNRLSWPRALGAWALLLPGVVAFQPTFGGIQGYLPALVGITLGAVLAVIGARFRWRLGYRVLAVLGAYLLVGGAVVLPETTILGFIPSLETLRRLSLLVFQGWNDLLTVATPAGDFSGPAAVPFLAGLIVGSLLVSVVLVTTAVNLPLLIPLAWLALAIAFGVRNAPAAIWLGSAFGAGGLAWQAGHRLANGRSANSAILLRKEKGITRTVGAAIAAALVIALAAGTSVAVNLTTGQRANRQVLRDDVVPPLNLHEYASPLTKYRLFELTKKDDVLFEVKGMPAGTRLRLAVLQTYDGNVFNVAQQENQYLRVGRELPVTPEGDTDSIDIAVRDYDGVWVPTFGDTSRIEFSGEDARREANGLYYNKTSRQSLTTSGIRSGSTLRVEAEPVVILDEEGRAQIATAGIGKASLAEVERVPDVVARASTDWAGEATSAYEQVAAIAERLRSEGFYSDGSDKLSRSGHTTERLGSLFNATQWIGDDEQYATSMALMVTQLGIPARVVMGFHPLDGDAPADVWEVTGTQAHVWVEANLDQAGWVAFDPTPDRDKRPQTNVPQPKPKPKPQVDPPPNPPEKLPEDVIVPDDEAANVDEEDKLDLSWLITVLVWVGIGAGVSAAVASPFLAIALLKRRRTRRRQTLGGTSDQLAGAWDDVVDRARDLGYPAVSTDTRREAAGVLQQRFPDIPVAPLAQHIDASVFGYGEPTAQHSEAAWLQADDAKKAMLGTVAWYARPAAYFSTRSLRRNRPESSLARKSARKRTEYANPTVTPRRSMPPAADAPTQGN